jgi:dihydrofolate synthase / folylpolyglutamate synthase
MNVRPLKTHRITSKDVDLSKVLDKYLHELPENSVLAVTSKIVAITEGRVVEIEGEAGISTVSDVSEGKIGQKDKLIEVESQYYLTREENPYNVSLTITHDMLAASAGIDESNADSSYVLWPVDPVASANRIRKYLRERFGVRNVGVIITDSKTSPLRWGVTAMAIGYSGIVPLKSYIDTPDLFGRKFRFEKLNIIDSLATAASVVMGEGSEQTPLAVITDVPFVEFVDQDPSREELDTLRISMDEDIFAPLLKNASWRKGKRS